MMEKIVFLVLKAALILSVLCQSCICSSDFFDIVELANLNGRVGDDVMFVRESNGLEAYQLSHPITISANNSDWINLSKRLPNSAYFAHIDSNYTGNVFVWSTESSSVIVKLDIMREGTEQKFLSVQILDREAIKFVLPASNSTYRTIGLRIAYGCTVTAFVDCYELTSADQPDLIHGINSTKDISIFGSASSSNMPKVSHLIFSSKASTAVIDCPRIKVKVGADKQGIRGPAGQRGPQGFKGDVGDSGVQGPSENNGIRGRQGRPGSPGTSGDGGDKGEM
ncbi:PREDICTED: collectin-12-like, partial [Amphimedon queenslandica]|uniref:Fucolectin tachylectin-4 pentraxin-1 domain-containing protein n=1 Tax=Amphimedon queenslandica TaxID=400682 RepID=A0AAN0JXZ2_AMPQE